MQVVLSSLLRCACGSVSDAKEIQGARLLPNRDGRRGEIRVGEVADGNSDDSGKAFVLPMDGEPQVGQKWKVSTLPLSARRIHVVALPAKVTCSRRNRAWLLMTAPVRRWHSRQWHMEMRNGSPQS